MTDTPPTTPPPEATFTDRVEDMRTVTVGKVPGQWTARPVTYFTLTDPASGLLGALWCGEDGTAGFAPYRANPESGAYGDGWRLKIAALQAGDSWDARAFLDYWWGGTSFGALLVHGLFTAPSAAALRDAINGGTIPVATP
mgnify:CR=1 FL=1